MTKIVGLYDGTLRRFKNNSLKLLHQDDVKVFSSGFDEWVKSMSHTEKKELAVNISQLKTEDAPHVVESIMGLLNMRAESVAEKKKEIEVALGSDDSENGHTII